MADRPHHYKLLQVDPEAEPDVIQAAYRRLAQRYHPDHTSDPEAVAKMAAINVAWGVLSDPARRAAYDLERAAASMAGAPAAGGGTSASSAAGQPGPAPGGGAAGGAAGGPRWVGGTPEGGPRPESVSGDWTTGRSTVGGGYDPQTMRAPEGHGAAGPPPGKPSGQVVAFGRYAGWSIGEIARTDIEYLEWLDRTPIGRPFREEIDAILRRAGRRRSGPVDPADRRGLFRRR